MDKKGRSAYYFIYIVTFIAFSGFLTLMLLPAEKSGKSGKFVLAHKQVKEAAAGKPELLLVKTETEQNIDSVKVLLHYYRNDKFHILNLSHFPGTNYFGVEIPGDSIGARTYYYLEALSPDGDRVILPPEATAQFKSGYDYFQIRFEGKPTFILLLLHIILMLAAILILIHSLFYALYYLKTGEKGAEIKGTVLAGIITFFITGFPIGMIIEKQVMGNYWEGVPFGWDITDSKTLIIFILWLILLILQERKIISTKGFAQGVILNSILTIILFLLPHSI